MKDLIKMSSKQRYDYLSKIDLNECNNKIIDYVLSMELSDRIEYSRLFEKSQKLLLGNNKGWENKNNSDLNFNIILIKLNVLLCLGYYEKFIKWSGRL